MWHEPRGPLAAGAAAIALGASVALARRLRRDPRAGRRKEAPGARRVLILGAGFGGLTVAVDLAARLPPDVAQITLVDRVNFHLFTPMLYQVATGLVEPGHIAQPIRPVARKHGFRFRQSEVLGIDLDRRHVVLDDGGLSYDALVHGGVPPLRNEPF
jgi:NADH dehydrogenase